MLIHAKKREGESPKSLLYRFSKLVQQSGVLKEAKKRRFHTRASTKRSRRLSALYKSNKQKDLEQARKLGSI